MMLHYTFPHEILLQLDPGGQAHWISQPQYKLMS
jgi:hypothetical protein